MAFRLGVNRSRAVESEHLDRETERGVCVENDDTGQYQGGEEEIDAAPY